MRTISIFVGRIYEAVRILELITTAPDLRFNFERFPVLKECFNGLEEYLAMKAQVKEPKPATTRTTNELVKDVLAEITSLGSLQEKSQLKLERLKDDFEVLSSRFKTKKRKTAASPSPASSPGGVASMPLTKETQDFMNFMMNQMNQFQKGKKKDEDSDSDDE